MQFEKTLTIEDVSRIHPKPARVANETVLFDSIQTYNLQKLLRAGLESFPDQLERKEISINDEIEAIDELPPPTSDGLHHAPVNRANKECQNGRSIMTESTSPIMGFLVSNDFHNQCVAFPLHLGRSLISSSLPQVESSAIIIEDETVSFSHASIVAQIDGTVRIVDHFSAYGTAVLGEAGSNERVADAPLRLQHGDQLRIGKIVFNVCLVKPFSVKLEDGENGQMTA